MMAKNILSVEDIPMLRKVCHEYIKTRMNREVNP